MIQVWCDRGAVEQAGQLTRLDLVVPFTTTPLTRAALVAANHLGAGLNADIRLLKVQVVPFPLDLSHSPVRCAFLARQLGGFRSALPTQCEIRLARDRVSGLISALGRNSVVVLAAPASSMRAISRRFGLKTAAERLASKLRRAGYSVVIVDSRERKIDA